MKGERKLDSSLGQAGAWLATMRNRIHSQNYDARVGNKAIAVLSQDKGVLLARLKCIGEDETEAEHEIVVNSGTKIVSVCMEGCGLNMYLSVFGHRVAVDAGFCAVPRSSWAFNLVKSGTEKQVR